MANNLCIAAALVLEEPFPLRVVVEMCTYPHDSGAGTSSGTLPTSQCTRTAAAKPMVQATNQVRNVASNMQSMQR